VAVRLLLIGAPGSGKGTQAVRLADRFGITHISSGDLLREHVRNETPIGLTIKEYVDAGDLVPDSVVMDMLYKPVVAATEQGGYVLDGFPRTVEQAEAAYDVAHRLGAEVKASIHLDVPNDELVRRLLARSRGSEDSQAVIAHRIEVYQQKTVPLLEYYAQREWLLTVDGSQSEDDVHEAIAEKVASMAPPASTD
jgi:adenylate kinase